jgi:hypothetical protein
MWQRKYAKLTPSRWSMYRTGLNMVQKPSTVSDIRMRREFFKSRGNPFKQLACIFDLEYADRDFISQFRQVDYSLDHSGTGFCCAKRAIIYEAGMSPDALREVRRCASWLEAAGNDSDMHH